MNDNELTQKLCIDGQAIRRIREKSKLTQLYVAKVVGVTTDTVSRWENNRYPTIRRDNALLLADALEVDLAEILLNGTGDPGSVSGTPRRGHLLAGLIVVTIVAIFLFFIYFHFMQDQSPQYSFTATRILPTYAVADGIFPVRVRINASGEMKGMILREHFPKGWKLVQSSPPPSSLDNVDGTVRWIIKPDMKPETISYLLQVPAEVDGSRKHHFSGEVIVNPRGSSITYDVTGSMFTAVGPYHWADVDGDSVIDDSETLAASESIDEMAGLHLSWETIEKIWDAGQYSWLADEKKFIPVRTSAESK